VPGEIIDRQITHFSNCDSAYGAGVAKAVRETHVTANSAPTTAGEKLHAAAD
jgi:catalase